MKGQKILSAFVAPKKLSQKHTLKMNIETALEEKLFECGKC